MAMGDNHAVTITEAEARYIYSILNRELKQTKSNYENSGISKTHYDWLVAVTEKFNVDA